MKNDNPVYACRGWLKGYLMDDNILNLLSNIVRGQARLILNLEAYSIILLNQYMAFLFRKKLMRLQLRSQVHQPQQWYVLLMYI